MSTKLGEVQIFRWSLAFSSPSRVARRLIRVDRLNAARPSRSALPRRLLFGVALLAAAATDAAAQGPKPPAPNGRSGRILGVFDEDTGEPIVGASVTDLSTGVFALTTPTGTVLLAFVSSSALVRVRKVGYAPWISIVDPSDTLPITVALQRIVALDPVMSTAKLSITADPGLRDGFERRCQAAHVTCVRDGDMRDAGVRTIGDYIQRADGMSKGLSMAGTFGGNCTPTFFVDGFRWDSKALGLPIDKPGGKHQAPFLPANVQNVEVYAATTARPLRFEGDPNCGVIVIWTK